MGGLQHQVLVLILFLPWKAFVAPKVVIRGHNPDCSCDSVSVAAPMKASGRHSYRHHHVVLPSYPELQALKNEVITILKKLICRPAETKLGARGLNEQLYICPPNFVPCPSVFEVDAELINLANKGDVVLPLALLIHHGELYHLNRVNIISNISREEVSKNFEVNDWPITTSLESFNFLFQYKKAMYLEPPPKIPILCRLPNTLFDEVSLLQVTLRKLLSTTDHYRDLLDGQLSTRLHFANTTLINHEDLLNDPLAAEKLLRGKRQTPKQTPLTDYKKVMLPKTAPKSESPSQANNNTNTNKDITSPEQKQSASEKDSTDVPLMETPKVTPNAHTEPESQEAEKMKIEEETRRSSRKKRSFFSGLWSFFFGNSDAVIQSLQDDFGKLQHNFKEVVSEEHTNFNNLVHENQDLKQAINILKISEISDKFSAMATEMEIHLLHRIKLISERVNKVNDNIEATVNLITQLFLMQKIGSNHFCVHSPVAQGCFNPRQSRMVLSSPQYLDLRTENLQLEQKVFVSCDLIPDNSKAFMFNNMQLGTELAQEKYCFLRDSYESDFFISTQEHKVNVLIGERQLKISCYPPVNVTVNNRSTFCNTESNKNPKFHSLHSFRIDGQEYISESINTYKFLSKIIKQKETEVHHLDGHLLKTSPLDFIARPIQKLGRKLGLHHSTLSNIIFYTMILLVVITAVIALFYTAKTLHIIWKCHPCSCIDSCKKWAEEAASNTPENNTPAIQPLLPTNNEPKPIIRNERALPNFEGIPSQNMTPQSLPAEVSARTPSVPASPPSYFSTPGISLINPPPMQLSSLLAADEIREAQRAAAAANQTYPKVDNL